MNKNKIITTDDLIAQLPKERQEKIEAIVKKNVAKWGGARANSGKKTIVKGKVLQLTKRVTEKEAKFIDYAREHNIDYDDLMQM